MKTITEYAHEYLQGYNTVPVGLLDDPEFKEEVRKLAGGPSAEEQRKYLKDKVARLEKALLPLYGPRGGLPKQYRRLEFEYHMLKGQLELEAV